MVTDITKGYHMRYAGFWKRFFAFIIDAFLLGMLTFIILFFLGFVIGGILASPEIVMQISDYGLPVNIIIVWLYFALQESSEKQATLGKRLLGIYVTDSSGEPIGFAQATIRYFGKYLSSIMMIGFIMIAFTARKQGLHDMLADTLVLDH